MTAIIVLDVETTGKDRARDQIIELCIQFGLHEGAECRGWRFKPIVPIHPEAQAVHGITLDQLERCRSFSEGAAEVLGYLNAADVIVGFNIRFDLDMLQAELARADLPLFDLTTKTLVDAMRLWQHFEPRTLVAAHEKFVGLPHVQAHQAGADVAATGAVLEAMIERFGLSGQGWDAIAALADPLPERHTWVGPSEHLRWDGDVIVFGFGRYEGERVDQVDPDYLRWMQDQDFPEHVKKICGRASSVSGEDFAAWIARFPRGAARAA